MATEETEDVPWRENVAVTMAHPTENLDHHPF
jgi:hypothetical protein